MQKFRPESACKICLTLLSLTLLTQTVFGYEDSKVSYLDSVSNSYIYNNEEETTSALLDMNSIDAKGYEATIKLDSNQKITDSNAKVNLSLRDSDIRQVLRMLADKANVNIVFDNSVEGKITLDLHDVSINDAFQIIFKSSKMTYTIEGKTINVMSVEAAKVVSADRHNMTIIPIKYVNASGVAEFLNNNLFNSTVFGLSAKPIVTSNPRTNQIVVFGNDSDVNAIKRVLPTIDTKPMINSFKVNHTTPEEMAKLLCQSILYTKEGAKMNNQSSDSSDDDEKIVLGGGKVACRDEYKEDNANTGEGLTSFKSTPLTVAYFPELGKINTYGGSVEQVEIIKEFIKEHDKKQLMAYIELSVIELNETGSKEFSNTWNLWTPFISLGFDQSNGLTTTSPFYIFGDKIKAGETADGETIVNNSNNKALIYKLKYLIKNGNGRVLTNPKIMVTNGKKAVIDMTSDYVKSVTSQILQSTATGGVTTGTTQKTYDIGSDEGLLIEIVPFISPDGYVSMNISPEFATIKGQEFTLNEAGQNELAVTLLQRRDLELKNIRIKDGETLVLAGLIKETETQTTSKMPLLSDLPFIGVFFRDNNTEKRREELVIVVTPHIVNDGQETTDNQIYDL